MATAADRNQLERELEATLLDQARTNELVIAWLRAVCLPVFITFDVSDDMLTVFGAVEPLNDHADRAVHSARAMLAAVDAHNRATGLDSVAIRVGIGVHSGPVVAGCLGAPE